ncbi:MAG TPA: ABC transporter ATP-binding protein [Terriglobales bacterium]|nr:ABC transporter ATP-binding protein [Terriglobales bacterium]
MALLELTDVEAAYGSVKALHGVSLRVDEGSIVALLGANGAGKTTTLRAISGTVRKTGGNVLFDDQVINLRSPEDVARMGIAHVPEGRGTLAQLTVWENLKMGAYVRRDGAAVKQDFERVVSYFPWIGQRRDQVAVTLSGGEQQMLAIARALMLRPRMMLLDEPSLGLAPLIVQDIYRIIETINREERTTILLVEQNARTALSAANHAYVIEVGRIAVEGTASDLASQESIRRSYLGY